MIPAHTSRRVRVDSRDAVNRHVRTSKHPKLMASSAVHAQNAARGGNMANGAKIPTSNGGFVAVGIAWVYRNPQWTYWGCNGVE